MVREGQRHRAAGIGSVGNSVVWVGSVGTSGSGAALGRVGAVGPAQRLLETSRLLNVGRDTSLSSSCAARMREYSPLSVHREIYAVE